MKALPVYVYHDSGPDCTNHGVSSIYNRLLVICDEGFVDVDESNPPANLVQVVRRVMGADKKEVYHLEPVVKPAGAGWMFGGNYAATSDSRFERMVGGFYGAVAIHDRQEDWESYYQNLD